MSCLVQDVNPKALLDSQLWSWCSDEDQPTERSKEDYSENQEPVHFLAALCKEQVDTQIPTNKVPHQQFTKQGDRREVPF